MFEIPSDYAVTRENFVDVLEEQRKKRRAQQGDPEMEQAISESLRELGWANDPQTRQLGFVLALIIKKYAFLAKTGSDPFDQG